MVMLQFGPAVPVQIIEFISGYYAYGMPVLIVFLLLGGIFASGLVRRTLTTAILLTVVGFFVVVASGELTSGAAPSSSWSFK